jgi:hypothetical protein
MSFTKKLAIKEAKLCSMNMDLNILKKLVVVEEKQQPLAMDMISTKISAEEAEKLFLKSTVQSFIEKLVVVEDVL